jgi:hypothetical protein
MVARATPPDRDTTSAQDGASNGPPFSTGGNGTAVRIGPNLLAAIVSFLFVLIGSQICLLLINVIFGTDVPVDEIGLLYSMSNLLMAIAVAFAGSLLFLLLGLTVQLWESHRPFAPWWPVVVAFPAAWAIFLPEQLVRGGSAMYWMIVSTAIALAFAVHWLALVAAREAME